MNHLLNCFRLFLFIGAMSLLVSCEKEINVNLPDTEDEIVMEAYINQYNPYLNYVVVSTTTSYFDPAFVPPFVKGASIYVSEGLPRPKDTLWGPGIPLQEVSQATLPGVYLNPSVHGRPGYAYKITAEVRGRHIEGITSIPPVVEVDSVSFNMQVSSADTFAYLSVFFQDPAARGNNYRMMFVRSSDSTILTWPDIHESDLLRDDEYLNGKRWEIEYMTRFNPGDTINYYLLSVDRKTYNFWNSYFTLRSNNGNPFATPLKLRSNFVNATGCFSGYAVSYRRVIVPKP